mgnify:FL=1
MADSSTDQAGSNTASSPGILKRTIRGFSENRCTQMAAALSYYTVFSLAPLLIVILTVAGFLMRQSGLGTEQQVREQTVQQIRDVVGAEGAEQIAGMLAAVSTQEGGWLQTLLNIAGVLFGATVVVMQLQTSLNQSWQVQPDPEQGGIKTFISKRLLSLALVIGVGLLLLVLLVATTLIDVLRNRFLNVLPESIAQWLDHGIFVQLIYIALQVTLMAVLIGVIFKVLPDCVIQWRDVMVGALVTAVAFVIGRYAIGLYLSKADVASGFGAAGSLALLLVWIYYSSIIFFLGAEFTHACILERGGDIVPEEGAVRVITETKPA